MPAPVNFFSVFRPSWEMCGRYFIKISQNGNMIFDSVRLFLTHFTVPFLKRFNEHNLLKVRKNSKSGPEKVWIQHKSAQFRHYSSLVPVVRNVKFCISPTGQSVWLVFSQL